VRIIPGWEAHATGLDNVPSLVAAVNWAKATFTAKSAFLFDSKVRAYARTLARSVPVLIRNETAMMVIKTRLVTTKTRAKPFRDLWLCWSNDLTIRLIEQNGTANFLGDDVFMGGIL
jgi:hypothetical protein